MNWLAILELATALLTQALKAFAAGQTKEAPAQVILHPDHVEIVRTLAGQSGD